MERLLQTLAHELYVCKAKITSAMHDPTSRYSVFSALFFLALFFACTGSNIETVETKDEQGRLERYERRKKDFAKAGLYQKFHPDGKVYKEARYTNDTLDGECKYFRPNGSLESVEHYTHGVLDGKYASYYENKQVQVEQTYVNGALQGLSTAYYPNGKVKEKVMLRDNDENGPFTEYYENGQLKAEGQYTPGEDGPLEQGELKEYDEQGQLVRVANCVSGVCTTKEKK
ncbi:MAG: toxin-antitoxin system YwqK family antitoxin [Saprospiraceae bacterium]|nr:toxin-antitoxin system YwqK family antitoxin [Saprospiraceae bacterium]